MVDFPRKALRLTLTVSVTKNTWCLRCVDDCMLLHLLALRESHILNVLSIWEVSLEQNTEFPVEKYSSLVLSRNMIVKWSLTGGGDLQYKRFPIITVFNSDWLGKKLVAEERCLLMRGGLNRRFNCICLVLLRCLFVCLFVFSCLTEVVCISLLLQNMCVMCLLDQILLEELLSQILSIHRESFLHF